MKPDSDPGVAEKILRALRAVEVERQRRLEDPELQRRVAAVKRHQQQRFEQTYADLLANERYGAAARFFLNDLYGPDDFSQRDAQFARIVPKLCSLLPEATVQVVLQMAALHALTERLDSELALALPAGEELDGPRYAAAWQRLDRAAERERQLVTVLGVGQALDGITRRASVRLLLRSMRGPARAMGFSALQAFLERGIDSFAAMRGSSEFLRLIETREREFLAAMENTLENTKEKGPVK